MFKNMKDRDIKMPTTIIIICAIGCIVQGILYLLNPIEVNPRLFAIYSILYGLEIIWNINLEKKGKNC